MTWDWAYAWQILPDLFAGVVVTVLVTVGCAIIALIGGLLLAVLESTAGAAGRIPVRALLELFRGVPVLVFLYFGFYALPEIGVVLPAYVVGIFVLGVVYAAYCSEVYRGALITIPAGLRDDAVSLSRWSGEHPAAAAGAAGRSGESDTHCLGSRGSGAKLARVRGAFRRSPA